MALLRRPFPKWPDVAQLAHFFASLYTFACEYKYLSYFCRYSIKVTIYVTGGYAPYLP